MQSLIAKAESYCKTLRGQSEAMKQSKLYAKFGGSLGIKTCESIAKRF